MKILQKVICFSVVLTGQAKILHASPPWTEKTFQPTANVISPFGYGPVYQEVAMTAGQSGQAICQAVSPVLNCHSVSEGISCGSPTNAGSVVNCLTPSATNVDETRFAPVNCNGNSVGDGDISGELGAQDWCLAANYMPTRLGNTIYQYNDYVRLGVNKLFGGSIFELYGTDKQDRILENGGGGMQLSLWAYTSTYAPSNVPRAFYAVSSADSNAWRGAYDSTPFPSMAACQSAHPGLLCIYEAAGPNLLTTPQIFPCAWNGAAAAAPYNPIQATSGGCEWGFPSGAVDSTFSPGPGQVTVTKNAPANYTRSDVMSGVNWSQTTQVVGPAAVVTYSLRSSLSLADNDFQEIPAIFLHQGIGSNIYYYSGTKPYNDVSGSVTTASIGTSPVAALQLPGRPGPFGVGSSFNLTEDWVSTCDINGKTCVTIATFSSASQDIIAAYSPSSSYFGVHGFFSLLNNLNRQVTVFVFPYRFDDVVQGRSIRAWIYSFHLTPSYRK